MDGLPGPEPNTNERVYPALLYYRAAQALVVAYGIGELQPNNATWGDGAPTVEGYFNAEYGRKPERYAESRVAESYRLCDPFSEVDVVASIDKVIDEYKLLLRSLPSAAGWCLT